MRADGTTDESSRRHARVAPLRRLVALGLVGACALAGALVAAGLGPQEAQAAKAPRLIKGHKVLSVACVPGPANTVRARVHVRMFVVNYDNLRDWADRMEAKVRLEPTTAGLNFTRSWTKWKTPRLIQNKRHRYDIKLTSDNVSGTRAWRVHLKLVWHRPAPIPNVSKNVYLGFNGSCGSVWGQGSSV